MGGREVPDEFRQRNDIHINTIGLIDIAPPEISVLLTERTAGCRRSCWHA